MSMLRIHLVSITLAVAMAPPGMAQPQFVWDVQQSDSFRVIYETERSISVGREGMPREERSVLDRIETFWVVRRPRAIDRIEIEVRITGASRTIGDGPAAEFEGLKGLTMFPVLSRTGTVETVLGKESALEIGNAELAADANLVRAWTDLGAQTWLEQPFLGVPPEEFTDDLTWQRVLPIPHGMSGQLRCLLSASVREVDKPGSDEEQESTNGPPPSDDADESNPVVPSSDQEFVQIDFNGILKFVPTAIPQDATPANTELQDATLPFRLRKITASTMNGSATIARGSHRLSEQELNFDMSGIAGMANGLDESDVEFRVKLTQRCQMTGFRRTRISPARPALPTPMGFLPGANP